MSIKNTKSNARSIYMIKYVTCTKVLQDLNDFNLVIGGGLGWVK